MNAKTLTVSADEKSVIKTEALANAVYKKLKQKDGLFAELSYVSAQEIKKLNAEFRDVDKITDVLSFPTLNGVKGKVIYKKDFPLDLTDDGSAVFIGSIAICKERATEQAREYGHSVEREMTYLLCHGLLHLMGYDHETEEDKIEMRKAEEEIMAEIKVTRE